MQGVSTLRYISEGNCFSPALLYYPSHPLFLLPSFLPSFSPFFFSFLPSFLPFHITKNLTTAKIQTLIQIGQFQDDNNIRKCLAYLTENFQEALNSEYYYNKLCK